MNKIVAIIVAHPDDETLWAGGIMLRHPTWHWHVICLCRKSDQERATRFYRVLKTLHAKGVMGDLDDGPAQTPLNPNLVEQTILHLIPPLHFDLVITHNPTGEYTKHIRHEETSKAVINLWQKQKIRTKELWTFAYEDGHKNYLPKAMETATAYRQLTYQIWLQKYALITKVYGFENTSWEAKTTPRAEAFWEFNDARDAYKWLENKGVLSYEAPAG